MAGMSVDGLVSGMGTTSLISQLMQLEAQPQTLLKNQLAGVQADAAAYRALNTRFDGLRAAAEAVTAATAWTSTKATSSSTAATAAASTGAAAGSLTFTVDELATAHSVISTTEWSGTAAVFGLGTAETVAGTAVSRLTVGSTTVDVAAGATLGEAVTAINAKKSGVTATAVRTGLDTYKLQLTTDRTGLAGVFTVGGTTDAFQAVTVGHDAKLTVGSGPGAFAVTSATNDFTGLLAGTTISVSKQTKPTDDPVTVKVSSDPDSVAAKVSALVTAANGLLDSITAYTDPKSGTAVLKGDSTLRTLSSQVLGMVSSAVGSDGSVAAAGLQLTRDGQLTFDPAVFSAKLKTDPALVQRLFAGTTTTPGKDPVSTADDVVTPTGIAGKLQQLAKAASNSTTGTLTLLARSKDSSATDIQDRIADWDLRLASRKTTLTRQFTAMESALGTLQNQGSWLSSQIASLPSWSKSSKS